MSEFTNEVVCPHCGHEHSESNEFFAGHSERSNDNQCESCDKYFDAVLHISFSYSTTKTEKES